MHGSQVILYFFEALNEVLLGDIQHEHAGVFIGGVATGFSERIFSRRWRHSALLRSVHDVVHDFDFSLFADIVERRVVEFARLHQSFLDLHGFRNVDSVLLADVGENVFDALLELCRGAGNSGIDLLLNFGVAFFEVLFGD